MNQKNLVAILSTMVENNLTIKSVNWTTGEVTVVPNALPRQFERCALTDAEINACYKSKIDGIKQVRNDRGWDLYNSKAFVEQNFDFISWQPVCEPNR